MRRFTIYAIVAALALAAGTAAQAQQRGRQGAAAPNQSTQQTSASRGGNNRQSATATRPASGGATTNRPSATRPTTPAASRPSTPSATRPSTPSATNPRPGNSGHTATTPDKGHGGNQPSYRPGGSQQAVQPGQGGNNQQATKPSASNPRPGGVTAPGHQPSHQPGHQPAGPAQRPPQGGYGPGPGHGPGTPPPPPPHHHGMHYTHHVPFFGWGNWHRPTPPAGWMWHSGGPSFGTIMGITLGTALDLSLRTLINGGYTVASYGNDVIYLTNVMQMNYLWPDAAMYYQHGRLCGSQFTYPTPYYDTSRYYALYNIFSRQYGAPVSMINQGNTLQASWFGYDGRYVTLTFGPSQTYYYTTLSFGI